MKNIFSVFIILAIGALITIGLVKMKKSIKVKPSDPLAPLVRVMTAHVGDTQLTVASQGVVVPRTESALFAQVTGKIVSISPSFAAGGFFEKNDPLVQIDKADYELAVQRSDAQVAQARLATLRAEQEAEIAREEWNQVGEGEPSPLVLHEPQLAEVKAALASAKASLELARLNLKRTTIRAPYTGRIRAKNVDLGQYVGPGAAVARIYAVDYAEVRLPLTDADLAFLDVGFDFRGESNRTAGPETVLQANFVGQVHEWQGQIVRLEGEIDPRTQMIHAVMQIEDPYGRRASSFGKERPPLAVGLFVDATIFGKWVKDVVILPRGAVRNRNEILVIDEENKLRIRQIEIVSTQGDEVIIKKGVSNGERICLSQLEVVVDGMPVRTPDSVSNKSGTSEQKEN
ncbi:MAG: hypothetical protein B6244_10375 [Candidatus Cloacimonetes bacterium 4572_55]|nr:MAG: hypothetical protein B6244_10375 [Candidatus Cloacimonetes bacterium 4572_55]